MGHVRVFTKIYQNSEVEIVHPEDSKTVYLARRDFALERISSPLRNI